MTRDEAMMLFVANPNGPFPREAETLIDDLCRKPEHQMTDAELIERQIAAQAIELGVVRSGGIREAPAPALPAATPRDPTKPGESDKIDA